LLATRRKAVDSKNFQENSQSKKPFGFSASVSVVARSIHSPNVVRFQV
jgi:hypothetical protein